MKTAHAIQLAGNASALAAIFGISLSAVSQWREDVPEPRYWELRVKRPEWFHADGTTRLPDEEGAAPRSGPPDGADRRAAAVNN